MKESLIVLLFFGAGVLAGVLGDFPAAFVGIVHEASNYAVYAMLAAVGMTLGFDVRAWRILRDLKGWVALVPLMIAVGTFLGGTAAWAVLDMSFRDVMAVSAGFGYYSLSSMLINQLADVSLGSMALIANMVRELVTLLFAPLIARVFGGLGPLSAAGAASDTCLPAIIRTSGERNTILGIFSGMVLTVAVPFFVTGIFAWM
ncbi:lysine exporter LysO family protein [uncultured Bilophila sp.]|uniref:lysine exporter LysO family protein n=1 Tax=uncultured Bilophila sp. TaxID=529385 RepID=UPI0025D7B787|nr:lysine exporter LysO family protein [uncultured Bilophila sp.]